MRPINAVHESSQLVAGGDGGDGGDNVDGRGMVPSSLEGGGGVGGGVGHAQRLSQLRWQCRANVPDSCVHSSMSLHVEMQCEP